MVTKTSTGKGKLIFHTEKRKKPMKLANLNVRTTTNKGLKISRRKKFTDRDMSPEEKSNIQRDFRDEKPPIKIEFDKYLDDGGSSYIFNTSCPGIRGATDSVVKMLKPQILTMKDRSLAQAYVNMNNKEALFHKDISDHLPLDVVKVYKTGVVDKKTYILMQRMNQINLGHVVKKQNKISLKNKVKMMVRLSEIIKNVHELGYFHMDIKPENILLTKSSKILNYRNGISKPNDKFKLKLADFGSAKYIKRDLTLEPNEAMGTPEYMAPEQVFGTHNTDYRADIFSLGMIFYDMIYCKRARDFRPFISEEGELDNYALYKYVSEFEPKIEPFSTDYIPLENLVRNCLRKDPNDRYQTMEEVHNGLSIFYDNYLR